MARRPALKPWAVPEFVVAAAAVLLLMLAAPQPAQASPRSHHKILLIVEENLSRTEAMGAMPYLSRLGHRYGQATHYYGITHPSLPNYLAIFGGSTFGVSSDCQIGPRCAPREPSIWRQTLAKGLTVRAYNEALPKQPASGPRSKCAPNGGDYYTGRRPVWIYWTPELRACTRFDVPAGRPTAGNLLKDVKTGNLPVTGLLVPNLCHDAHSCQAGVADTWLRHWIPVIQRGPDWRHGDLTIIITFDEDDFTPVNNVAFVVADPRLHNVTVTRRFNHYSLFRWLEDNARVRRIRHGATAPNLRAAFGL